MGNGDFMQHRDIVVIGGSAGALDATQRLLEQLHNDLPAAIFVVHHRSPEAPSVLDRILARHTGFYVSVAVDDTPFEHGRVYVASPDQHLVLERDRLRTVRGPRENCSRPAIDPLFRSAAVTLTTRVIGVLLSGWLDDGVAGLVAIKRCGGCVLVHDPADAIAPAMPKAALDVLGDKADAVLEADKLGQRINELVALPAPEHDEVPRELLLEDRLMRHYIDRSLGEPTHITRRISELTDIVCPDCHGPLSVVSDATVQRFRCSVGHAFTTQNLLAAQGSDLEQALWAAMRSLRERSRVLERLAADAATRHATAMATVISGYRESAGQALRHAETLERVLLEIDGTDEEPERD